MASAAAGTWVPPRPPAGRAGQPLEDQRQHHRALPVPHPREVVDSQGVADGQLQVGPGGRLDGLEVLALPGPEVPLPATALERRPVRRREAVGHANSLGPSTSDRKKLGPPGPPVRERGAARRAEQAGHSPAAVPATGEAAPPTSTSPAPGTTRPRTRWRNSSASSRWRSSRSTSRARPARPAASRCPPARRMLRQQGVTSRPSSSSCCPNDHTRSGSSGGRCGGWR